MTKVLEYFISINIFEQQCVVIESMLQSLRFKYHMNTIVIYQPLRNSAPFEHRCLQNIKKLYKHAGKCDDQHQFKEIIEAALVANTEGFTNNSTIFPVTPTPIKKPSARKSLFLFTNIFYVRKKTSVFRVRAAKSKRKSIRSITKSW